MAERPDERDALQVVRRCAGRPALLVDEVGRLLGLPEDAALEQLRRARLLGWMVLTGFNHPGWVVTRAGLAALEPVRCEACLAVGLDVDDELCAACEGHGVVPGWWPVA